MSVYGGSHDITAKVEAASCRIEVEPYLKKLYFNISFPCRCPDRGTKACWECEGGKGCRTFGKGAVWRALEKAYWLNDEHRDAIVQAVGTLVVWEEDEE
jgi:hypothetical protein